MAYNGYGYIGIYVYIWCVYIYIHTHTHTHTHTQCVGMMNKYRVVILSERKMGSHRGHSGSSTLSLIFHSLKSTCSKYGKKFKI